MTQLPGVNRRVLITGAAVAAAGHVANKAFAQSTPVAESGTWAFTDSRNRTLTLESPPKRVAAMTYAAQTLFDFGYQVAAYLGPDANADQSGEFNTIGDLDFTNIPYLGGLNQEFDIEALLEQEIDLVVSYSFPAEPAPDAPVSLWFLETAEADLEAHVPTLGIAMAGVSAEQSIAKFAELAISLGADYPETTQQEDQAYFSNLSARLNEITSAKPELTVAIIRNADAGVIVPAYNHFSDLLYFAENGVQFIGNDKNHLSEFGGSWYSYSYEELNLLSADVILQLGDFSTVGTWESLPAVTAGQLGVWETVKRLSYRGFGASVERLISLLDAAEKVTS